MINPPTGRSDLVFDYIKQDNCKVWIYIGHTDLFRDYFATYTLVYCQKITPWKHICIIKGRKGENTDHEPSHIPHHVKSGVNRQHKWACCYCYTDAFAKKSLKFLLPWKIAHWRMRAYMLLCRWMKDPWIRMSQKSTLASRMSHFFHPISRCEKLITIHQLLDMSCFWSRSLILVLVLASLCHVFGNEWNMYT